MSPRRVLIVGGGIGGLTTAAALQQAGSEAVIFESRDTLEEAAGGAGVHLWSNALFALHQIGLAEDVAAIGTQVNAHRYVTWKGRRIGGLPVRALSAEVGAPTTGVSRQRLHRVLHNGVAPGTVRFGRTCVGFEQNTKRVVARFDDGTTEEGDALVGADGLGSVIRRQLHGRSQPRYSGLTSWRGLCDFDDARAPRGEMIIYWGRGARLLHYGVSDNQVYWLALVKAPERSADVRGERKQAVQEIFRGWPASVQAMLAATQEEEILRTDIRDRDPLRHWGWGRVTLLGDAAHPMTPDMAQGAGQAIEDGVALAAALGRHPRADEGLRAYEERRQERGNDLAATSRAVSRMGAMSAPALCAVRDGLILPFIYATQRFGPARKNLTAVL